MKGKLYIFGIGGTGSRVLKSLVMLAASGVKVEADAIVPIVIDPDFANADLTRTLELIKTYSAIRKELSFNDKTSNTFFSIPFEQMVSDNRLSLQDTKNKKFRDFKEYSSTTPLPRKPGTICAQTTSRSPCPRTHERATCTSRCRACSRASSAAAPSWATPIPSRPSAP